MAFSHRRLVVIALAFGLTGCAAAPIAGDGSPSSTGSDGAGAFQLVRSEAERIEPADPTAAGDAVAAFGAALFGELPTEGNLVISPYSVYTALAMTRPGAEGACATELDDLLGADAAAAVTAVDEAMDAAETGRTADDPRAVVFDPANAIWAAEGSVLPALLDELAAGFDTGLYATDFIADPEGSRQAINGWVSDETHALIPELIPAGVITEDTRMTLVNALYLAAQWNATFSETPEPIDFTSPDGAISAPGFAGGGHFAAASGDGWQSVTLPYVGGGVAMTLIVPDSGRFDEVAGALNAGLLADATSGADTSFETLQVPEFGIDTSTALSDALRGLGMAAAFDDECFTKMIADEPLGISDVIHQAVIDVDKDGTVAAAATAVVMSAGSAPEPPSDPKVLIVDRPFFFVIHDTLTGAPLFLGRVVDPTA